VTSSACELCGEPIGAEEEAHWHHDPVLRSDGGTRVVRVHSRCHLEFHQRRGDFALWGRIGGEKMAEGAPHVWARNLRNVRTNSAYAVYRDLPGVRYGRRA